jgi:CheY-like chemotaxis protein
MKMNENRRILIVDDEPYNQLGLKIMLRQARFS